ncbi:hypothetical protein [Alicyclobacillus fodiniaquatilis]|uniref:Uncharacterized protein n=1 Tax=Alicyclobacillus fodiniaquatilis TaxID=1661150 RepID=A0ABW4JD08_9BACL
MSLHDGGCAFGHGPLYYVIGIPVQNLMLKIMQAVDSEQDILILQIGVEAMMVSNNKSENLYNKVL